MSDDQKASSSTPSTSKKKVGKSNLKLLHPAEQAKRASRAQLKYEPSYVAFTRSRYKIFETTNPFTSDYQKTYITPQKSPTTLKSMVPSMFLLPRPKSRAPAFERPGIRVTAPSSTRVETAVSKIAVDPKRLSSDLAVKQKMLKHLMDVHKQFQEKPVCTCGASKSAKHDIDVILKDPKPKLKFREQRISWLQQIEDTDPGVDSSGESDVEDTADICCFPCRSNNVFGRDPSASKPQPKPIERNVKIKIGKK